MRTAQDICLLCLNENATQRNSHIVSKFISKGILGAKGSRKGFILDTENPERPKPDQDTAKEDFILCPSCESYLHVLETYIAENLHKRILHQKYNDDFTYRTNPGGLEYAICNNVNRLVARLFFTSIYWRCSITSTLPFVDFKLAEEELIRKELFRHKTQSISDLLIDNDDLTLNNKPLVIIRSKKGRDQTYNYLIDRIIDDGTYLLGLNEYLTMFGVNETLITQQFGSLANKGEKPLTVIIANGEMWNSFTQNVIKLYKHGVETKSKNKKSSN
ncbi:hypothetical protein [Reichenbachiella sp. MALMAid0571]|uniref:hypothetical protein n=1 Tax=Reichenbachiella sp. MALMAid0571 TaxID=3143939 RepID=UPI0032DEB1A3